MPELHPEEIPSSLARFGEFHDALVRHVTLNFLSHSSSKSATVLLSAQDFLSSTNGEWVNVLFELQGVQQFTLAEKRNTTVVVVYEFEIDIVDEFVRFDFGNTSFTNSDFMLVAKQCHWSVLPYSEVN